MRPLQHLIQKTQIHVDGTLVFVPKVRTAPCCSVLTAGWSVHGHVVVVLDKKDVVDGAKNLFFVGHLGRQCLWCVRVQDHACHFGHVGDGVVETGNGGQRGIHTVTLRYEKCQTTFQGICCGGGGGGGGGGGSSCCSLALAVFLSTAC